MQEECMLDLPTKRQVLALCLKQYVLLMATLYHPSSFIILHSYVMYTTWPLNNNVTPNSFYFNLDVLKFELQYKWTPPQHKYFSVGIIFYNYYVTIWREPMISSLVKNSWNRNFANFRHLALILPEAATRGVL